MNGLGPSEQEHRETERSSIALAIASAQLTAEIARTYRVVFEEVVRPVFANEMRSDIKFKGAYNRLRTRTSQDCLTVIWKESEFVPRDVLDSMGLTKHFTKSPLTKNGLGTLYCRQAGLSDPDEVKAMQTNINRICDSAALFGLIAFSNKNGNRRPLSGTSRLHDVMMKVHIENVRLIESVASERRTPLREAAK
ncbi:hypothetical protein [Rhizobium sp. SL42]|uniref:hypothetical protein n=1 Tax=Rhizobium sp. SL42 TaxID=2806346 RepID=UPI001F1B7960|nr:hypothetical protein [Rhizobium sp. SL42]UJW73560.1 hypothetical protein IM739_11630 [Rhizobium sp. SL42]